MFQLKGSIYTQPIKIIININKLIINDNVRLDKRHYKTNIISDDQKWRNNNFWCILMGVNK